VRKNQVEFIEGDDGVKLAYRPFIYNQVNHAVFCFPGSSMSEAFAEELARKFGIMVFLTSVRGFGDSEGKRGSSSHKEDIWKDVRSFVRHFRANYPDLPLIVGGHFRSSGLVLNYSTWEKNEPADGYVFLSPLMSLETFDRDAWAKYNREVHTKIHWGTVILTALTGLKGDQPAVEFDYPDLMYKLAPNLVDSISANNVLAATPHDVKGQLKRMGRPYACYIGENDKFFKVDRVLEIFRSSASADCEVVAIKEASHLGTIIQSPQYIGPWITQLIKKLPPRQRKSTKDLGMESLQRLQVRTITSPVTLSPEQLEILTQLGLHHRPRSHLVSPDGAPLAYTLFEPQGGSPRCALVFLGGLEKALFCHFLAAKYQVRVYHFLGREGSAEDEEALTEDGILGDVRSMVRFVRRNQGAPVVLGGHGVGASTALVYSSWPAAERVNYHAFLSPVADLTPGADPLASSQAATHVRVEKVKVRTSSHRKLKRILSKKTEEYQVTFPSAGSPETELRYATEPWEAWFPESLTQSLQSQRGAFFLLVGDQDELVNGPALVDAAQHSLSSQKEVLLHRGGTHLGVLITAAFHVGTWIDRFVAPEEKTKLFVAGEAAPTEADFIKIQSLGRGAFGTVFLVQHKDSQKFLALKCLKKAKIVEHGDAEARHVIRERNVMRELEHPFAVKFFTSFQTPQHLFLGMEYVIGGELYTQVRLEGRFEEPKARFYVAEIILFFEYIHSHGIVFRDLKLENVLLDAEGHIKIIDFGFAKKLDSTGRTKTICGTPEYVSPEMIARQAYTFSVDHWSLGVLAYELMHGFPPFSSPDNRTLFRKILYQDLVVPPHTTPAAKDFLTQILSKDPTKRLGANGEAEIKAHPWFQDVDWDALLRKEIPAPMVPRFAHEADASNFITYKDTRPSVPNKADYGDVFADF